MKKLSIPIIGMVLFLLSGCGGKDPVPAPPKPKHSVRIGTKAVAGQKYHWSCSQPGILDNYEIAQPLATPKCTVKCEVVAETQCGKASSSVGVKVEDVNGDEVICPNEKKKAPEVSQILIFTAPWCPECKLEIPKIMKVMARHASLKDRTVLTIETGETQNSKPTDAVTKAYVSNLGWDMASQNDPWRTQIASKFYNHVFIPAAVITDKTGNAIRVFEPGSFSGELDQYLTEIER